MKLFSIICNDFEQGNGYLVSSKQRLIQVGEGISWNEQGLTRTTHTVIFQLFPWRSWSSLLLKQRYKTYYFVEAVTWKYLPVNNDISSNKEVCVMILNTWLDSWLSKSRIFHIEKVGFDTKNLLTWLDDFSLLF